MKPVMSIADANAILLADPRFAVEDVLTAGHPQRRWLAGAKAADDLLRIFPSHGNRDFLVFEGSRCSYASAAKAIDALSHVLRSSGMERGDRVALVMRNRLEWPICFFAVMAAGGIVVPINGWSLAPEIDATILDCGARFLFSDQPDLAPSIVGKTWFIGDADGGDLLDAIGRPSDWTKLPEAVRQGPPLDPDATAAIFYTSGTTSTPKGATITHRALTASIKNAEFNAERVRLRFPPPPGGPAPAPPVALFPIPFFHVTGAIPGLIASSTAGATLVLMRKWDVDEALGLVERERVTMLGGVPTIPLQMLVHPRRKDFDLSSLATVIYGGGPSPSNLPASIETQFSALPVTGWGMTETASTVLHNSGPEYLLRPASCGVAVPVNDVRIADVHGEPVPNGTPGELQVRGLNVTRGYWNRDQANLDAFTADGWFRTGDLACIDPEGFVTIVDRLKDIIIRGGENIGCVEIEDVLTAHPGIVEAAVVGRSHPSLGEEPVAFVSVAPAAKVSEAELLAHASACLPRHKVPVRVFASAYPLPRNPAGKVLKVELRAQAEGNIPNA